MIRTFRPVGPLVRLSLAAALAVAACGGSSPTSPSPSPTFTPPPVSGRVTGESGAPLEGVTVRLLIVDGPQTAITDGNGRFEFDRAASGAELTAEKPGFEPNVQYLFGQPTQDFTLRGIARIIAGDSRRVTITPLDSLYGLLES